MKKYKILTPLVVFGIREENGQKKDYTLKKGDTVDLPENNIAVQALLSRKQIVEIPPKPLKGEELPKETEKNSKK